MTTTGFWDGDSGVARVDTLKSLIAERVMSYGQIASRIGTTRAAVCSKVHRLGIGHGKLTACERRLRSLSSSCWDRTQTNRRSAQAKLQRRLERATRPILPPDPVHYASLTLTLETMATEAAERADLKSIDQLNDHDCRYPAGDLKVTRHIFCGKPKIIGEYCLLHGVNCLNLPTVEIRKPVQVVTASRSVMEFA